MAAPNCSFFEQSGSPDFALVEVPIVSYSDRAATGVAGRVDLIDAGVVQSGFFRNPLSTVDRLVEAGSAR